MDYEKAYKAAKRLAAHWIENSCEATERILLTTIFPELKESEDERIRKEIITYLYNELHNIKQLTPRTNQIESWVTYLEKQKEQKPADIEQKVRDFFYAPKQRVHTPVEIDFADKYSHQVWEKLMAKFDAIEGYRIGANDVSDIVLNAILNTFKFIAEQKPDYCHHEVDLSGCLEEYRKGYYDGWNNCNQQHSQLEAEQKPAEWSEEETVTDYHQLEEEIDRAIDDLEGVAEKDADGVLIAHLTPIEHLKDFARHFYELGVKARKEE